VKKVKREFTNLHIRMLVLKMIQSVKAEITLWVLYPGHTCEKYRILPSPIHSSFHRRKRFVLSKTVLVIFGHY
jgi:hypothetical protein